MGEKIYELKKIKKKGKGMPLIGDKFPKMEVQTTQGMMKLPKTLKANGLFYLAILLISHQYAPLNLLPSSSVMNFSGKWTVNSSDCQWTRFSHTLNGLSGFQKTSTLTLNSQLSPTLVKWLINLGLIHPEQRHQHGKSCVYCGS